MIGLLVSFAVGLGIGGVYALLGVRSPAPPVIALVGLLGMFIGEQAVTGLRGRWSGTPARVEQGTGAAGEGATTEGSGRASQDDGAGTR